MSCITCGHPLDECDCSSNLKGFELAQAKMCIQNEYAFLMEKLASCIQRWNKLEPTYTLDNVAGMRVTSDASRRLEYYET